MSSMLHVGLHGGSSYVRLDSEDGRNVVGRPTPSINHNEQHKSPLSASSATSSQSESRASAASYTLFVKHDVDAFMALFINNIATLLVVVNSLLVALGEDIVYKRVVPAVGLSMAFGNVMYVWQARRLAIAERRTNVCAQPYGINTPGAFAFVYSIIYPIAFASDDGRTVTERRELAWKVGVAANFAASLILLLGSFVGHWLKRLTPPVALLTSLAGIGDSHASAR